MAEKCLSFDGVDDHASLLNPQTAIGDNKPFSIELWIKRDSAGAASVFIGCSGAPRLYFRASSYFGIGNTSYSGANAPPTIPADEWVYWVVTYGDDIRFYINGSWSKTVTKTDDGDMPDELIYIGGDAVSKWCKALIDEVRISDKVRSADEISAIWNNGNGVQFEVDANTIALWHMNEGEGSTIYDETNNDNDGSITGASWTDGYDFLTSHPTSSDTGSALDASALSEVFFSADSGTGLGALVALLAVINTSEVSSGCDRLSAKIESATSGGDMKLPPGGQASMPSRKVGI